MQLETERLILRKYRETDFESKELGYVLNRNYWGKGFAAEACAAVIQAALSAGAHRIYAECDPKNAASWKLLERLGFVREAHFRQNVYFWTDRQGQPIWKDTYVYSLLATRQGREYATPMHLVADAGKGV